ncbi:hypothetical protein AmaxDRAFT_0615 [Limnospira maxima CS-328]|uniref:Uncharacterized protein n=1 Tax=Limnospira maxima CS-328 TaxID=513049 RepID=B5VVS3_LIMMA|nr:hypothetical protein AmaxDRAFT_4520 [Limnospira maxima CS-328]EDZ96691.1 hypothetical protein AmaxDRAFT_0615 [Limnospira maxima CS-328]
MLNDCLTHEPNAVDTSISISGPLLNATCIAAALLINARPATGKTPHTNFPAILPKNPAVVVINCPAIFGMFLSISLSLIFPLKFPKLSQLEVINLATFSKLKLDKNLVIPSHSQPPKLLPHSTTLPVNLAHNLPNQPISWVDVLWAKLTCLTPFLPILLRV